MKRGCAPLGDVDGDLLLRGACDHVPEHNVRDLLDLGLGELAEHDDLIETVEELGAEVLLELLHHERLDAVIRVLLLYTRVSGLGVRSWAGLAVRRWAGL